MGEEIMIGKTVCKEAGYVAKNEKGQELTIKVRFSAGFEIVSVVDKRTKKAATADHDSLVELGLSYMKSVLAGSEIGDEIADTCVHDLACPDCEAETEGHKH
jgi:hypothetical protein